MRKTGRHTFIIDGNYFLFRTLYILPHHTKTKKILSTSEDGRSFLRKLATDFAYQIRLFDGLIDKVVWTVDSRSWRKDFYPNADYKGNRVQDSNINWDRFLKVTEEFISILSKHGVIISKIDGTEGDDLIYAWNTESLANDKSVIMFTGDRDLIQLVNRNDNGSHTILFSPTHNKLYTYQGFSEWLIKDEESSNYNDIFDIMKIQISPENQARQLLSNIIKKKKIEVIEVDPEEFRFRKVLIGDSGDNVPSAYWHISKNRRYGISEKKADAIVSEFKERHGSLSYMYLYNEDYITDLANILIRHMNAKHMSREQIISNIKSNVNLMVLTSESIPESILDEMFKSIESNLSTKKLDFKKISDMKLILKDTPHETDESIQVSAKVFKDDEDDEDDFSFIKDRKSIKKLF